jgi:hypothetical protein
LFGLPLGRPAGIPWLIYLNCLSNETVYLCLPCRFNLSIPLY